MRYTEFFGESGAAVTRASGNITGPDRHDFLWGQLSQVLLLASALTTLAVSVSHVVGVGSEEEMNRINAWWIIAVVQDLKTVGNHPEMDLPRIPVGLDGYTVDRNVSVAVAYLAAGPLPTSTQFGVESAILVYQGPESLFGGSADEFSRPGSIPAAVVFPAKPSGDNRFFATFNRTGYEVVAAWHDTAPLAALSGLERQAGEVPTFRAVALAA